MTGEPFTGQPKIGVEFPRIVTVARTSDDPDWPGLVTLYKCSICQALTIGPDCQAHADWHSNERMRNFAGF
jgi:hypothetical protein